jgi:sulfatase modifying factor 1
MTLQGRKQTSRSSAMNQRPFSHRTAAFLLLVGFAFSLPGTLGLIPGVEAASPNASARIIQKLKKQIASLKRQLAAARAVPPTPAAFLEMVTVGNPGNGTDAGNTSEASVYGAVSATFQIGKFEVTNAQYVAFLNAVAATDTNGLFNTFMETDARGGIDQFGTNGSFRYAVRAGMGDKPVIFVSFWDGCRFCNWLHNGRPGGAQSAGTTETGSYDLTIPGAIAGNTVTRSPGAKFFLPTENQWYKAAYHQPASAGGDADGYWRYPTKSNDAPTAAAVNAIGEIEPDTTNIANYTSGADWDSNGNEINENGNVTAVGSGGAGGASFYGAFDMGGNVWEWNEAVISGSSRWLRGGSWVDIESDLSSSIRFSTNPGVEFDLIGFRVASP